MNLVFRRIGIVVLMIALLPLYPHLPSNLNYAHGQSGFNPEFVPSACPEDIQTDLEIECGFIAVPERHADPDGSTIRLTVMVLHSPNPNSKPDPLVMAQGGPGGSTIDFFGSLMASGLGEGFLSERDVILIEQRGTFYSKPNLVCEEFLETALLILDQPISVEENNVLNIDAALACHDRLIEEGINLSAFNSIENAADVPLVISALGYADYNYYGVSYGTMLAQHLMRDFPDGLRSVIIDAVVPLELNFIPLVPTHADRAFRVLFDSCKADPACDTDFPNLETVFFDLVDDLNTTPMIVELVDPDNSTDVYDFALTGDRLVEFLFQSLYVTSTLRLLPRFIYTLADGDPTWVEFLMPSFVFNRTRSGGMYYSVMCAEDADFDPSDISLEAVYDPLAEVLYNGERFPATCAVWDVDALESYVDDPIVSDIPILVLSGEFDPITPSSGGQQVLQTLSNSYEFTFPGVGHGALLGGGCPIMLMQTFLDDPLTEPDATCIDQMGIIFASAFSGQFVEIEIDAQPLTIATVMPAGWQQIDNILVRGITPNDPTTIITLSLGEMEADTFLSNFATQLGSDEPVFIDTLVLNETTWERYDALLRGSPVVMMFTTIDSELFAFLLFADQTESNELIDSALLPMTEAFRILN